MVEEVSVPLVFFLGDERGLRVGDRKKGKQSLRVRKVVYLWLKKASLAGRRLRVRLHRGITTLFVGAREEGSEDLSH